MLRIRLLRSTPASLKVHHLAIVRWSAHINCGLSWALVDLSSRCLYRYARSNNQEEQELSHAPRMDASQRSTPNPLNTLSLWRSAHECPL